MATTAKQIDFSGVKDGGGSFNRNRIPSGDYVATIVKVEDAVAKSDDVFQYLFSIKIDKYPTRTFPYYCKLAENQLWKLRNLLIAAGLTVPKRKVKVDPNKAVGKKIGVTIEDAEYEGKEQSEIAAVFPAAELMEGNLVEDDEESIDEVEEEEEDVEDTEEEVDEPETDPIDEMDRSELKAAIKGLQSDFVARKSQTDDDLRDLLRSLQGAAGADDEEEEEDEEPAPKPRPKAKAKAAPARKAKVKSDDVSDEDLEDLDIDDLG